jgi:hypothetical protein
MDQFQVVVVLMTLGLASTPNDDGQKLTVADALKWLSLDESKLKHIDEPPGKLRELEGEAVLRDTKIRVRVRLELVYTLDLFSAERKWDPKAVRAATVRMVKITRVGADK